MAQASSVPAREPSMEEILASIRRIIEDSDHATPAGNDAGSPPADAAAINAPEQIGQIEPVFTEEPEAADIDAFRSELSEPEAQVQEPEPDIAHQEPASFGSFDTAAADIGQHAEAPVEEPAYPAYSSEPEHSSTAGNLPQRTSIISETAERQVAAAFEELSDAFASSQKRSFDEIAEELMRPMLQDWLDNNLPVLVERLVREEIERVARGATR